MPETNHIQGKRILLICQDFYGYDVAMKDTLYSLGAKEVVLYNAEDSIGM